MPNRDILVTVRADVAKVWVDGTPIKLNQGAGVAKVKPGAHHALSWAVRGAAGTTYSVKITAPPEAKLTRGDTFDDDQFDAGLAWFKIREV